MVPMMSIPTCASSKVSQSNLKTCPQSRIQTLSDLPCPSLFIPPQRPSTTLKLPFTFFETWHDIYSINFFLNFRRRWSSVEREDGWSCIWQIYLHRRWEQIVKGEEKNDTKIDFIWGTESFTTKFIYLQIYHTDRIYINHFSFIFNKMLKIILILIPH